LSSEADLLQLVFAMGDQSLQLAVLGSMDKLNAVQVDLGLGKSGAADTWTERILVSLRAAAQAILPLTLFLLLVFRVMLRERFSQADEIFLGIGFALIGMTIFFLGIELGLSKLGNQVGGRLPAAYTSVELTERETSIQSFDKNVLQTAIRQDGEVERFFYVPDEQGYKVIAFDKGHLDEQTGLYRYVPTHGPIFGGQGDIAGLVVVLIFAFFMGYGATLAEPALNTLGATVEDLTVGTFKKNLLIQTVGIGVGVGISLGVAKIIWDLPLFWMLAPPYLLLLAISAVSSE